MQVLPKMRLAITPMADRTRGLVMGRSGKPLRLADSLHTSWLEVAIKVEAAAWPRDTSCWHLAASPDRLGGPVRQHCCSLAQGAQLLRPVSPEQQEAGGQQHSLGTAALLQQSRPSAKAAGSREMAIQCRAGSSPFAALLQTLGGR